MLQDEGTSCPRRTTAISWNQQGPAGPAGTSGIDGGTVTFVNSANNQVVDTCTVVQSFGPDAVTVAFDQPNPSQDGSLVGCEISRASRWCRCAGNARECQLRDDHLALPAYPDKHYRVLLG